MPARNQALGGAEPAVSLAAARILALSNIVSIHGMTRARLVLSVREFPRVCPERHNCQLTK
jgi:hypothetical protein